SSSIRSGETTEARGARQVRQPRQGRERSARGRRAHPRLVAMNPPARTPTPLWASLLVASASGIILAGAFPGLGWWPLAFVGTAGMLWSLADRTLGQAALIG